MKRDPSRIEAGSAAAADAVGSAAAVDVLAAVAAADVVPGAVVVAAVDVASPAGKSI
jgi:hypothetical protein